VFVYLRYAPGHAPPEYITWGIIFVSVLVLMKHHRKYGTADCEARASPRPSPALEMSS